MSLQEAVHKMSGMPAEKIGIRDRGLLKEGYKADILAFDMEHLKDKADYDRCDELATRFDDVAVICADPSDEATLKEEGVRHTDAFISLTGLDEENILLSLYAKGEGARKVITRINRIEYNKVISRMELDSIVYPKNITASMILRYVRATSNTLGSSMETLYTVIKGQVEASEFTVGTRSPIAGVPLSELSLGEDVLIAAILRGRTMIIPRGVDVIEPGDSVVVVTKRLGIKDVSDILKK